MIRAVPLLLCLSAVAPAFSFRNNNGILSSHMLGKGRSLVTLATSISTSTSTSASPPNSTPLNAERPGPQQQGGVSRRDAIAATTTAASAATGGLATADVMWRILVRDAWFALATEPSTAASTSVLPPGTLQTIESGKAAIIDNWLTPEETRALCDDARDCFREGHFTNFILSRNPKKADKFANDRWIMPSFASSQGVRDGPFVDPTVGSLPVRESLKRKMAAVKASLATGLTDRPTLSNDIAQTHEMEYLRYGAGALLNRHTDEHHLELKRPHGSSLPLKANASRRSITWLVYLNDDWTAADGGELRLHERAHESVVPVGARNRNDLQVGWLRAIPEAGLGEQPVFLDPFGKKQPDGRLDPNESCLLYTFERTKASAHADAHSHADADAHAHADADRRELSGQPFANAALYLGGGDALARGFMVDDPVDRRRFHLIDAPKSLVAELAKTRAPLHGEDGGEQYRDILPRAGTLVLFDSVSLPHEVLTTNRERFGVQGWFHEMIEQPL